MADAVITFGVCFRKPQKFYLKFLNSVMLGSGVCFVLYSENDKIEKSAG